MGRKNTLSTKMQKETIGVIRNWCIALLVLAIAIVGIRGCCVYKDRKREEKKQAKIEKILNDKFLYFDNNGVYHADVDCGMLIDYHFDANDNMIQGNYSSQYILRSDISGWRYTDWYSFAADNQLCSECFSPEIIRILKLGRIGLAYKKAIDNGVLSNKVSEERFVQMLQNEQERKAYWEFANEKKHNFYSSDYDTFSKNVQNALAQYYDNKITSLYNKARKKGILNHYDSEEWFREQISTEKGLRSFYDYATNNGMKIRPYDEFKQRIGRGQNQTTK